MNIVGKYVSPYLKAHVGGLTAALALVIADLNSKGGLNSANQWYAIVGAFLGSAALIGAVPNIPVAPVAPQDFPSQDIVG